MVEETGGPGEINRPVTSHGQILSHNVVHDLKLEKDIITSIIASLIGMSCANSDNVL